MNDNQKNSLWIHCPICGGKTRTKVYDNTVLVKFPLYCPKCKKEIKIGARIDRCNTTKNGVKQMNQTYKVQSQLLIL